MNLKHHNNKNNSTQQSETHNNRLNCDTQHQFQSLNMLSLAFFCCYTGYLCIECCSAKCRGTKNSPAQLSKL
jgi:hypothetical protein